MRRITAIVSLMACIILATPVLAANIDVTWTGDGSDNLWSNSVNWDPETVPNNIISSDTFNAILPDGSGTIRIANADVTLDNLTIGTSTQLEIPGPRLLTIENIDGQFHRIRNNGTIFLDHTGSQPQIEIEGEVEYQGTGIVRADSKGGLATPARFRPGGEGSKLVIPDGESLRMAGPADGTIGDMGWGRLAVDNFGEVSSTALNADINAPIESSGQRWFNGVDANTGGSGDIVFSQDAVADLSGLVTNSLSSRITLEGNAKLTLLGATIEGGIINIGLLQEQQQLFVRNSRFEGEVLISGLDINVGLGNSLILDGTLNISSQDLILQNGSEIRIIGQSRLQTRGTNTRIVTEAAATDPALIVSDCGCIDDVLTTDGFQFVGDGSASLRVPFILKSGEEIVAAAATTRIGSGVSGGEVILEEFSRITAQAGSLFIDGEIVSLGTIEATNGTLNLGAPLRGGNLAGAVLAAFGGLLENVNVLGTVAVPNGVRLRLVGTFDDADFVLDSEGGNTFLEAADNVVFAGDTRIRFSEGTGNQVIGFDDTGNRQIENRGMLTLEGLTSTGGRGSISIRSNSGDIFATNMLETGVSTEINSGSITAGSNATMSTGIISTDNTGGIFCATDGGQLVLENRLIGGALSGSDCVFSQSGNGDLSVTAAETFAAGASGSLESKDALLGNETVDGVLIVSDFDAELQNVALDGVLSVPEFATLTVIDSITNSGEIRIEGGAGNAARLRLDTRNATEASLRGGGRITMTSSADSEIVAASDTPVNSDNVIQGEGLIAMDTGETIVNDGMIIADQDGRLLITGTGDIVNNGVIAATGAGGIDFGSSTLFNRDELIVEAGSQLLGRRVTQETGRSVVAGFSDLGIIIVNGGVMEYLTEDVIGNLNIQGGRFSNGPGTGLINVDATFTVGANGVLQLDVGGFTPGGEHDQLRTQISGFGSTNLDDGTLCLGRRDDFFPIAGDSFTVLEVAGPFANPINGQFQNTVAPPTYEFETNESNFDVSADATVADLLFKDGGEIPGLDSVCADL